MNPMEVDELLHSYGVRPGNRASRMELARALAEAGITASAMAKLAEHAKKSSKTPETLLGKVLSDGSWKDLAEDLDYYATKESERSGKGGNYPSHYGKGMEQTFVDRARANGQSLDEFHAERDEQHAAMRVLAERRTVAETAAEMQWLPERVHAAIDRWAPYFGVDPEIVLAIRETGTAKARKLFKMT